MIKIEHLSKNFGNLSVLRDINIEIREGEVISVIGPSGSGKSTLLRCINLLERPSGGSIRISGIDLLDPKTDVPKIRQKMNMVFQSFNLFDHLTTLENLTIAPVRLLGKNRAEAEQKAMELLTLVGLGEKASSLPSELSGGQKQRVAIARCLAMDPEIILFDEPTSSLDPTMVSEVLSVIRRLAKEGMTMVIVTHEMDFARDVSHRVLYIDDGIIYEEGPPEKIFNTPEKEKTRAFINRIRSIRHRVTSPSYDIYTIRAEIEAFCEKQILSAQTREKLLSIVEEILRRYKPVLSNTAVEMTLAYSEKKGSLELTFEHDGKEFNPCNEEQSAADTARAALAENMGNIEYRRTGDHNRLSITLD